MTPPHLNNMASGIIRAGLPYPRSPAFLQILKKEPLHAHLGLSMKKYAAAAATMIIASTPMSTARASGLFDPVVVAVAGVGDGTSAGVGRGTGVEVGLSVGVPEEEVPDEGPYNTPLIQTELDMDP